MARLNEPAGATAAALPAAATIATSVPTTAPPTGESVDALKRRFIRQNRELAKHNSNQSLRIRTLELDVSRLLAENLELRNQVLHLENELYTAQSHASSAALQRVKKDLQAKIAELSGLVDGIEDARDDCARQTVERKPLEGNWKERQPLSEVMRENTMPTILENKLYPRRTLGAEEIQAIRLSDHSSTESPDLGPPPVARLACEDPVKSASPLVNKSAVIIDPPSEEENLPIDFSINLETRRKRKDGQGRLQIKRHSLLPESPAQSEGEASSILRTGAKRKLADREGEKPIRPPSTGDFTFSRKMTADETKNTEKSAKSTTENQTSEEAESLLVPSWKPTRKILADKSVNMSPRKTVLQPEKEPADKDKDKDKPDPEHPKNGKENSNSTRRRSRISSIPLPTPQDEILTTIELAPPPTDLPPRTPAEPDLFSPTPSEPSTLPGQGRGDTPPPGDLSTLSSTTTMSDGNGIRPSRRARSAVNYAEPSLVAKMRRPDKKLVDAVTGLQDPRRAMSASSRRDSSQMGSVKKEQVDDDDVDAGDSSDGWKNLPLATHVNVGVSSPLRLKGIPAEDNGSRSPLPVFSPDASEAAPPPPSSSATISALMAAGRKRRESGQLPLRPLGAELETTTAVTKKPEAPDIYEFKESSSPMASSSDSGKALAGGAVQPRRSKSHRRHSSVPKGLNDGSEGEVASNGGGREGRAERIASRRRSMQL